VLLLAPPETLFPPLELPAPVELPPLIVLPEFAVFPPLMVFSAELSLVELLLVESTLDSLLLEDEFPAVLVIRLGVGVTLFASVVSVCEPRRANQAAAPASTRTTRPMRTGVPDDFSPTIRGINELPEVLRFYRACSFERTCKHSATPKRPLRNFS
jgi:hypothetical protein